MKTISTFILCGLFASFVVSCGSSDKSAEDQKLKLEAAQEKQKLEEERIKLEEEKLKLEEERIKQEELAKREAAVEIAKLENRFPAYTESVVVVNKANFHTTPDAASILNKKFLVNGDVCVVIRTRNGFGYVEFYNEAADKTTTGWLNLRDLEPY